MPYLIVRESYMNGFCMVDGLPLNEFRILGEKCSAHPDTRDEKNRRVEFPTTSINILNCLEQMGYRVVTSGSFVAGQSNLDKYCQKEFIWTMYRPSTEIECQ
ncbi:uncharacterized protein LOC111714772 [Eurytemora carolleeae]|uniref:uncharacterized protein LOC111714772 n=1 Tax=Eurytemora carolleeae TaxID=1294199 RepID=UPI000C76FCA8|nr:uncharacterized protein LOC111714772 [Eurytemora carolleeae]|eukprot:XP_023345741.1 uncharacterized protein LOC111714772 [Eurytemora affinis]